MIKTIVVLLLMSATISYAMDLFEVSVENAPSGVYDTNVVAMTWMPAYCKSIPKNNDFCTNEFKLHGIWPYYISDKDQDNVLNYHPSNCYHSKGCLYTKECNISEDTISFLSNDKNMQRTYPKSLKLWSHEWKKHGTCSGLNQKEYFEEANTYLPRITPHYDKLKNIIRENKNSFVDVGYIYKNLPKNISLRCLSIEGVSNLFEVNFFFNKSGHEHNKVNTQIGDKCIGEVFLAWLD